MDGLENKVRFIIICFSVGMFCFQFNIAMNNILEPPVIDTTYYKSIGEVELPLITVCPTNQTNLAALKEFGYKVELDLLAGLVLKKQQEVTRPLMITSWGGFQNISFKDLLKQNFFDKTAWIDNKEIVTKSLVFITRYGFCIELSDQSADFDISISADRAEDPSLIVFITDRNFRSYFSLDYSSNKGRTLDIEKDEIGMFDVDIEIISSCNIMSRESLDSKDKYKKCVDDQIQKEIGVPLGCIPPWMSSSNHCNGTYAQNWIDSQIADFNKKFVEKPYSPYSLIQNTEIEKKCRKYCSATIASVHTREKKRTTEFESEIRIAFNQQVKVTEKIFNYGPFQFVIDVGSSVGLWLGLSVLGIVK